MGKDYTKPFDDRLNFFGIAEGETDVFLYQPYNEKYYSDNVYSYLMPVATLVQNIKDKADSSGNINVYTLDSTNNILVKDGTKNLGNINANGFFTIDVNAEYDAKTEPIKKLIKEQTKAIEDAKGKPDNRTLQSIMNPYAMIHLSGSLDSSGGNNLIDTSLKNRWYEPIDGSNYSKEPTTENIIKWGKADLKGRTPYLFQDFVFCKWWNKIPNNRLITLRRYTSPILDNLSSAFDNHKLAEGENDDYMFPPISTLVTYFGDDTGNNLKDIMKFSTGVPWGEVKADVWELTSSGVPSTNDAYSGALGAIGLGYGNVFATIANALHVFEGGSVGNGLVEGNGLPPDPYKDGPYTNRILGIVNRIDTVRKRDPGINFEMQGLKIKFSYVARPIGGINSKAVMLDILANFLTMGSATAQFFGGAHRSRIPGKRFPASADPALKKLYQGKLFGKDGAIHEYANRLTNFINDSGGITGLLATLWDAAKGLLGDLIGSFTGEVPQAFDTNTAKGGAIKQGVEKAITEKMRSGMPVSYVSGMRALLTGEPVGDWHLTIGNPLNPIAMIGNLICTNLEVEIDEEAGFGIDDFPLGWTMTVTLDHGMKRDRDAIESMFNFGNGRIYELPERYGSTADNQTPVDQSYKGNGNAKATAKEGGGYVVTNPLKGTNHKSRYRPSLDTITITKGDSIINRGLIYITDFAAKKSNRG